MTNAIEIARETIEATADALATLRNRAATLLAEAVAEQEAKDVNGEDETILAKIERIDALRESTYDACGFLGGSILTGEADGSLADLVRMAKTIGRRCLRDSEAVRKLSQTMEDDSQEQQDADALADMLEEAWNALDGIE